MAYPYEYPYTDPNRHNDDWALNEVKRLIKEWTDTWGGFVDLEKMFQDLEKYVYNYFANLDVSDAIYAKLDDMLASGQLAIIIAEITNYRRNVLHMGVDNTGTHDASAQLNAAFSTGGKFYLPKGTYLLEHSLLIPSNVDIIGDGLETILKASSDLDAVYHTVCSKNAENINARLCLNVAGNGYPDTTLCSTYVENVKISSLVIDGNCWERDLENWNSTYEHDGYTIYREYGTNCELQRVRNVTIENVTFKNGIQHNFNIRAAANSYNQGLDYIALYPSYNVRVVGCTAVDNKVDDSFTTHDSEYIVFDSCTALEYANMDGRNQDTAVSNGFEIDDGSRYVTVINCTSKYTVAGYQAKGHANTPAAHDVSFINCTAQYTRDGFTLQCKKSSGDFDTDKAEVGRCMNIKVIGCRALNLYPFTNVVDWTHTVRPLEMQNTLNCTISDFTFDSTRPTEPLNLYHGNDVRTIFNMREVNYNVTLRDINIIGDIIANYNNTALFPISGSSGHIVIENVKMEGYTGDFADNTYHPPIIRYNNNNQYNYLTIRGVYAKQLHDYDKILSIPAINEAGECLLQGARENIMFYNVFHGEEYSTIYGFTEVFKTGLDSFTISPIGNTNYIVDRDCTITLSDTQYMRLAPISISMSGGAAPDTISVTVVSATQPDFNITKTLHRRELLEIRVTKSNGLMYN